MSEPIGRGWLRVTNEYMASRLGLPEGVKILRVDMGDLNTVGFALEGPGLPEWKIGQALPPVGIQFESRIESGVRTVYGAWSHKPEVKWRIAPKPAPAHSGAPA